MPVEHHGSGGTTITGPAIEGFRGHVLLSSIKLWLETGLKPTRGVGPKQMAAIAAEYTGRTYTATRKGMERAVADLELLAAGKDLDQLADVRAANALVGGEAADLSAAQD